MKIEEIVNLQTFRFVNASVTYVPGLYEAAGFEIDGVGGSELLKAYETDPNGTVRQLIHELLWFTTYTPDQIQDVIGHGVRIEHPYSYESLVMVVPTYGHSLTTCSNMEDLTTAIQALVKYNMNDDVSLAYMCESTDATYARLSTYVSGLSNEPHINLISHMNRCSFSREDNAFFQYSSALMHDPNTNLIFATTISAAATIEHATGTIMVFNPVSIEPANALNTIYNTPITSDIRGGL